MFRFDRYLFLLLFSFFILFSPWVSQSEVVTRVVAVVNGEIITSQELDQMLRPLYSKYKNAYEGQELIQKMEEARKNAIDQLVERKLVLQEAKKQNVQIDEKDVETRLNQIRKKFDSEDEFYYALEKEGINVDQLRENILEQLLVRTLTRQEVLRSVSVRPKDVTDSYHQNIKDFSEPEMIQLGQILVKKGEDKDTAYKKIKEVEAKLKAGGSFEALAKEYSQDPYAKEGGTLPFFAKGQLRKEIEEKAFAMEVGQTSDIIESDLGHHIIVLKARKENRVKPLSEAWSEIENDLYQKKMGEVHKKWVEELKKKAHIKIY